MLIDELREKLKSIEPDWQAIQSFVKNSNAQKRFDELDVDVNSENFWQNPNRDEILVEHRKLRNIIESYQKLSEAYKENQELIELFSESEKDLENIKGEIFALCRQVSKFKIELILNKPEDIRNCYLNINAGAGGTESQDWAHILLRMFIRFCEREDLKVSVLDYQDGEEAGIKSATLYVKGKNAFGFLKAEAGIHRLVRISPFDANKRRHTSFAGVSLLPEIADEKIEINESELRIDTYRAGGAGGQHVNKTDSAVRITHLPSGIVVQCQNERSQLQNKQTAMKMLMSKLVAKQKEERKLRDDASLNKKKIEWGSQIRSYVLHPYKMVKDHRTDYESSQPDLVLDGDIMPFIEAYLLQEAQTTES